MKYYYFAYGVPIIADFALPMLQPLQTQLLVNQRVIHIEQGVVPTQLKKSPTLTVHHISCNQEEFLYHEPNIATYYITNGNSIVVQQQGNDWEALCLYLYSSGLVIAMIQRDKLPFHVSGVRLPNDGVVLFAAPSGTGKSTMAVKLKEKGYSMFSDDTALIWVKDNSCYAQSSYPMLRLLPTSIKHQKVYSDGAKQKILNNWDKYSFSFQEDFVDTPLKVKAIVFLAASGEQIGITQLSPLEGLKQLSNNVFRPQCVIGMKKERVLYEHLSSISHLTPFFSATRPKKELTFDRFATAIENSILKQFI